MVSARSCHATPRTISHRDGDHECHGDRERAGHGHTAAVTAALPATVTIAFGSSRQALGLAVLVPVTAWGRSATAGAKTWNGSQELIRPSGSSLRVSVARCRLLTERDGKDWRLWSRCRRSAASASTTFSCTLASFIP